MHSCTSDNLGFSSRMTLFVSTRLQRNGGLAPAGQRRRWDVNAANNAIAAANAAAAAVAAAAVAAAAPGAPPPPAHVPTRNYGAIAQQQNPGFAAPYAPVLAHWGSGWTDHTITMAEFE